MKTPADSKRRLLKIMIELSRDFPPAMLNGMISALQDGERSRNSLARFAATPAAREKLGEFTTLLEANSEVSNQAIAFALQAAKQAADEVATDHYVEIAWTGPGTDAVPVRRVDQVIYEMVETAEREVLLVTYASYKAEKALKALNRAAARGVRVKLVTELSKESGGKLSNNVIETLRVGVPSASIYFWDPSRRTKAASGAYGAMHAKALVADQSRAIVSSANLTDLALELNMELGVVLGRATSKKLAEHFEQLFVRGELIEAN